MQDRIRQLLHLAKISGPLNPRRLAVTPRRGYEVEKLEFLSEPGIYIPTWVFKPARRTPGPPILFINENGISEDGLEFGPLESLARQGRIVAAVDVRGIGETRPEHPSDHFASPFGHVDDAETVMAYLAWEMNESLFGMRVFDILRSVDYLSSRSDLEPGGLHVIGKGMGALWVMFAAALDMRIQAVVAENGLLSYRALTRVDRYLHGANIFILDVLKYFDLPHVAAALAGRRMTLLDPVDPMKQPVALDAARHEYEFARLSYANAGAAERFVIAARSPAGEVIDPYTELLPV